FTHLVVKDAHMRGMAVATIVAPRYLAPNHVFGPLQPLKTNQCRRTEMRLANVFERFRQCIRFGTRGCWLRLGPALLQDTPEGIFRRHRLWVETAHHVPGPARHVDGDIGLAHPFATRSLLNGSVDLIDSPRRDRLHT